MVGGLTPTMPLSTRADEPEPELLMVLVVSAEVAAPEFEPAVSEVSRGDEVKRERVCEAVVLVVRVGCVSAAAPIGASGGGDAEGTALDGAEWLPSSDDKVRLLLPVSIRSVCIKLDISALSCSFCTVDGGRLSEAVPGNMAGSAAEDDDEGARAAAVSALTGGIMPDEGPAAGDRP